jgi:hypothetical protein
MELVKQNVMAASMILSGGASEARQGRHNVAQREQRWVMVSRSKSPARGVISYFLSAMPPAGAGSARRAPPLPTALRRGPYYVGPRGPRLFMSTGQRRNQPLTRPSADGHPLPKKGEGCGFYGLLGSVQQRRVPDEAVEMKGPSPQESRVRGY